MHAMLCIIPTVAALVIGCSSSTHGDSGATTGSSPTLPVSTAIPQSGVSVPRGFPAWPPEPSSPDFDASPAGLVANWMEGVGNPARPASEQEAAFARMFYGGTPVKEHLDGFLPRVRLTGEAGGGFARLQELWDRAGKLRMVRPETDPIGDFHVTSAREDEKALGGFADLKEYPAVDILPVIAASLAGKPADTLHFLVLADPERGRLLLAVANTSREGRWLRAADSRLLLEHESAVGGSGAWTPLPIERPNLFCGNSFHRVYLPPGKCWITTSSYYARRTGMRERLVVQAESGPLVSNEFAMPVAPAAP